MHNPIGLRWHFTVKTIASLFELARAYYLAAKASGMNVTVSHYTANIPRELLEEEERAAAQRARKEEDRGGRRRGGRATSRSL